MKKCVKCGTELIDQARFCTHCRAPQPVTDEMLQMQQMTALNNAGMGQISEAGSNGPKKGKGPLIAVISALVIVLLIAGGLVAYHFVSVKANEDDSEVVESREDDEEDEDEDEDEDKDDKDKEDKKDKDDKDSKDDDADVSTEASEEASEEVTDEASTEESTEDSKEDDSDDAEITSDTALNNSKISDHKIELNGKVYTLPCKLSEFTDNGFTISAREETYDIEESSAGCISMELDGTDDSIYFDIYNPTSKTVSIYDSYVTGMDVSLNLYSDKKNVQVVLPGGINNKTKLEDISRLLPDLETDGTDSDGWTAFKNEVAYDDGDNTSLKVYYTEGKFYSVSYTMTSSNAQECIENNQ
ncbi:MAG: hypothetical protein K6F39_01220 [Lachnospiraceae bacterium]|nr:hypothetical protein [Lachnospiraceae bacterium]